MKYSIINIKGMQYKVSEGDELNIDSVKGKVGDEIIFDQVLLSTENEKTTFGFPYIKDASVKAKILKHYKSDKMIIGKFRAKTGYRRRNGFRASKTIIKIEKIN